MKRETTPAADGFHMPAEYEAHKATLLIWPVRPGSWPYGGKEAKQVFARIAKEIAGSEEVYLLAAPRDAEEARLAFEQDEYRDVRHRIHVLPIETDDAWARDVGPTFVINEDGEVRGIDWEFNAWGGTYDGLYANWEHDDLAASAICEALDFDFYDCHPFVLEGGSIHSDGEGTLLVTESCLLSPGRNPDLSKDEIETRLKEYLGVTKVIWLPAGIYHDETNEHVDNVCAFTAPGKVVLAWTDDETDPQYAMSKACLDVLSRERDAKGRALSIVKLPIPRVPVTVREEDLCGYEFEEGEDTRELGERLAASYVNFYITNDAVLVPQFRDEHDALAREILKDCFPNRRVVGIDARAIIVGGGNIHCITQQIPKGR